MRIACPTKTEAVKLLNGAAVPIADTEDATTTIGATTNKRKIQTNISLGWETPEGIKLAKITNPVTAIKPWEVSRASEG